MSTEKELIVLRQILARISHGPDVKVQQFTLSPANSVSTIPEGAFWYSIFNTGTDSITIDLGVGGTFLLPTLEKFSSNERVAGYFPVIVNADTSAASAATIVWEVLT